MLADAPDLRSAAADVLVDVQLDLLLGLVGELEAVAAEELDPVVGVGVVRGGDHRREVEAVAADQQRRRRRRQDAAERDLARRPRRGPPRAPPRASRPTRACRGSPARAAPSSPLCRTTARPSASASCAVMSTPARPRTPSVPKSLRPITPSLRRARRLALGELRPLARLLQAGLLALLGARVARQEAAPLELAAQVRVGLEQRARDAVAQRAGLRRDAAAVQCARSRPCAPRSRPSRAAGGCCAAASRAGRTRRACGR